MKTLIFALLWLLPQQVVSQSTTEVLPPWQTGEVTPDGTCAGTDGFVCSPTWGACCSKDGLCGRSKAFCGDGCQSGFGNCNAPVTPPLGPGSPSTDGSCGGTNQFKCTGTTFGACCSSGGWCGDTTAHCSIDGGCQSSFGTCSAASNISSDGLCGSNGKICLGSNYGDCCSSSSFCGSSTTHCGSDCQVGFGNCTSTNNNVSTDGACGSNGKICLGSIFGGCCSSSSFCGADSAHCDAGCQSAFGTCNAGTGNISTDGACGKNGKICKGSTFGDCCSSSGFCGKTTDFCGAGCQTGFGTCTALGNISTDGACGKNGKTCKGSRFGDCCSSSGFCGKTTDFCGAGCQTSFGTCTALDSISIDGKCGSNGKTCVGSTYGKCCSSAGFCGSTTTHCGVGCQKPSSSACLTTNIPSVDGTCGASKGGLACAGSAFDNQCCSSGGFCGTTTAHCGTGCQKSYGRCS